LDVYDTLLALTLHVYAYM